MATKDIIVALRQRFCSHVFRGVDLQPRDASGMVTWPCSKCGKVHRAPYGIAISSFGKITGPWTLQKQ